ncbi:TetR/AcrR family transcriptional regulator [Mycobacterium eburneum]|nr:TetR/AcrR family transcriptional regulator [Mycobacterium eburneum]
MSTITFVVHNDGGHRRGGAPDMDARIVRTRAALLEASVTLVDERNPDEISMADIAARAGVSRQAIYDHFSDRDHVLAEAAINRLRQVISEAEDGPTQLPADGSPPATLTALMIHLTANRAFYQRLLSGRTGTVVRTELNSHNRFHFERMMDLPGPTRRISAQERAELVVFLAGGSNDQYLWMSLGVGA